MRRILMSGESLKNEWQPEQKPDQWRVRFSPSPYHLKLINYSKKKSHASRLTEATRKVFHFSPLFGIQVTSASPTGPFLRNRPSCCNQPESAGARRHDSGNAPVPEARLNSPGRSQKSLRSQHRVDPCVDLLL